MSPRNVTREEKLPLSNIYRHTKFGSCAVAPTIPEIFNKKGNFRFFKMAATDILDFQNGEM